MTPLLLRTVFVVSVAIAMAACGKNEEKKADAASPPTVAAQTKIYGKEDGECYAGIIRAADAKHFTQADFKNWEDKLADKDKDWFKDFFNFFASASTVVVGHLGKDPKQLYDAHLLTKNQLDITEGYMEIFLETDPKKASALSASACAKIGFEKGADLN